MGRNHHHMEKGSEEEREEGTVAAVRSKIKPRLWRREGRRARHRLGQEPHTEGTCRIVGGWHLSPEKELVLTGGPS